MCTCVRACVCVCVCARVCSCVSMRVCVQPVVTSGVYQKSSPCELEVTNYDACYSVLLTDHWLRQSIPCTILPLDLHCDSTDVCDYALRRSSAAGASVLMRSDLLQSLRILHRSRGPERAVVLRSQPNQLSSLPLKKKRILEESDRGRKRERAAMARN